MPPSTASTTSPAKARRPFWLATPAADVVIGAGAWSLPLLAVAGWAASNAGAVAAFLFYALALVVNYPHFAATVVRAYRGKPTHRLVTVWLTLGLVGVLIGAHLDNSWLPILFGVYLTWSPWHYTSQNRGIATLFLRRANLEVTAQERLILRGAFAASFLMWGLGLHSGPSMETLARFDLDPSWTLPVRMLCLGAFVAGSLYLLAAWWARANAAAEDDRARQRRGVLVAAVVISTQLLWFGLPWALEAAQVLQLTPLYFAAGALAVMHGAQYLWVIFFTEQKERAQRGETFSIPRHFALLVGIGAALFLLGPWLVSRATSYDLIASFMLFQAVVNIHHFAVDGVIWRLREPEVAAVFDPSTPAATVDEPKAAHVSPLKIAGGAVLVLAVAVGVVDVAQYSLTRAGATEDELGTAAALNPNDPRVHLRRAEIAMRAKTPDVALQHLDAGLAVAPQNGPLLRAKATVLAGKDDFEAAYQHLTTLPKRMQTVETLVHLSALAERLKEPEAAADWIAKAARRAPQDPEVLRHQGNIAQNKDDKAGAIEFFKQALVQTAIRVHAVNGEGVMPVDALLGNTPDPITLDVANDLGHLLVQQKQFDEAEELLKAVTATAIRINSPLHAMRAIGDASRVHTGRGKPRQGLQSLQRAIKIGDQIEAPLEEAELWVTLAATLERFDAPMALRFACMLNANNLGQSVQVFDGLRAFRLRKAILGNLGRVSDAMDKEVSNRVVENLAGYKAEALAFVPK